MEELRRQNGIDAAALEFAILCAARTGEVLGARWAEIDLDAALWVIPPGRIKAGREHRIPLSEPALAILRRMAEGRQEGDEYVFPGKRGGHLHDMALFMLMRRRMGRTDVTPHGFRATFRTWTEERTSFPREVAEQALAHSIGDAVEQAYRRTDLFEKRRQLMRAWATWCANPAPESGLVVAIGAAAG